MLISELRETFFNFTQDKPFNIPLGTNSLKNRRKENCCDISEILRIKSVKRIISFWQSRCFQTFLDRIFNWWLKEVNLVMSCAILYFSNNNSWRSAHIYFIACKVLENIEASVLSITRLHTITACIVSIPHDRCMQTVLPISMQSEIAAALLSIRKMPHSPLKQKITKCLTEESPISQCRVCKDFRHVFRWLNAATRLGLNVPNVLFFTGHTVYQQNSKSSRPINLVTEPNLTTIAADIHFCFVIYRREIFTFFN